MIARREADAGQHEARTQGAPILDIWARLRTRPRAAQRRIATWSLISLGALSALVLADPAAGHVTATPPFLAAGSTGTLRLAVPNELDEPMTAFAVTVPGDLGIVHAHPAGGWDASVRGSTATWSGGSAGPGTESTFALELETPAEPGPSQLEAVQRYADGNITWDVGLTVTPESETSSQNLGWALLTAVIGLTVIVALGVGVVRRTRTLQEK
jgi:uncharacterized protein YcnI